MTDRFEGTTFVSVILDKSGSMVSCADATRSAFNEYIEDLRRGDEADSIVFGLTAFDTEFYDLIEAAPVAEVTLLTEENYVPNGLTALYDAIGRTLQGLEGSVGQDDRALIVILTDGMENSSREFDQRQVFDLIQDRTARGNFTFVYLGANQDAFAVGASLGVPRGNTRAYDTRQMSETVRDVSQQTHAYSASNRVSMREFFALDEETGTEEDSGERSTDES